ncbi:MAG: Hsp20 family protein [Patescibacteria group bacterium]
MTNVRIPRHRGAPFAPARAVAAGPDQLKERIRRFFETPLDQPMWAPLFGDLVSQPIGLQPPISVAETPAEFTVTAELPGMDREHISLEYEDGMLTIRGEKEETREEKEDDRRYLLFERSYGSFARTFSIGGVDADNLRAEYKDGVLTIHMPKTPAAKSRGRGIPIT